MLQDVYSSWPQVPQAPKELRSQSFPTAHAGWLSRSWAPCLPAGFTKKANATPAKSYWMENVPQLSST